VITNFLSLERSVSGLNAVDLGDRAVIHLLATAQFLPPVEMPSIIRVAVELFGRL